MYKDLAKKKCAGGQFFCETMVTVGYPQKVRISVSIGFMDTKQDPMHTLYI